QSQKDTGRTKFVAAICVSTTPGTACACVQPSGARTSVEWRLDSGSIFTGFGAGAQAAVSVRDFAKLFPLTVQSRIGFEPPFDCPRFVPSRSIGYFVGRQDA